ncbi:hypothetical protein GXP70_18260 [Paenibacillus lycopersici]|uniref:Uncharacterized protein n=1 Tax=Paenibacillus lycopersici TaxID=2704462 RepID=A0A6C0FX74_9BACL|nr:hypothetical protein [Paenibacillus lycopersici]QHT61726.1 hypothetical protein GXP70_18260 [Paenibacillus lycopersici]
MNEAQRPQDEIPWVNIVCDGDADRSTMGLLTVGDMQVLYKVQEMKNDHRGVGAAMIAR